jgi:hypothetical protein
MKHAKFFSVSVALALALYGAIGFYFLPLADFEGGLTRMGKLPETMFGWTREQPAITPELLLQSSWQDADVFVIGDSFSMEHLWQVALTRRGLKVHTETWENIRGICEILRLWLRGTRIQGPLRGIRSDRKKFRGFVHGNTGCRKMFTHSTPPSLIPPPPLTLIGSKLITWPPVGRHSDPHAVRTLPAGQQTTGIYRPGFGQRYETGPRGEWMRTFSHPRSDALFFSNDRAVDFGPDILLKMETVQSRLQDGLTMVWAVVPDKSTAYLNTNKTFWRVSAQRFHAPDLLGVFRSAIENNTVDLYRGNDTHLSTSGYLLMGDTVYQSLPGKQPLSSPGAAR